MSVQSSLDPYGSNTTLASSASSEMDTSGRKSSGGDGETHSGSPHSKNTGALCCSLWIGIQKQKVTVLLNQ